MTCAWPELHWHLAVHEIIIMPIELIFPFFQSFADSVSSEILTVQTVDLCIQENGKAHRSGRFELMCRDPSAGGLPKLVVRRGQSFKLRVTTDRPFSPETDAISCIFTVANEEQPSHGHGTLVGVGVVSEFAGHHGEPNEWYAVIESVHGNYFDLIIKPSVRAAVTQWKLDIDTKLINETSSKSYSLIQPFYLLFNPWCKDDQVYLEGKWYLSRVNNHKWII